MRRHGQQAAHVPSVLDAWLSRGASVAQIVGVVLALAGLFYTVIPLYQKAAVDEQLARSEAELKTVEASLQRARTEAYGLTRDDFMRAETLRIADDCSGILYDIMHKTDLNESRGSMHSRLIKIDINVDVCMKQHLGEPAFSKTLNSEDMVVLSARSKSLATELEASRQRAILLIAELPEVAKVDPARLDSVGEFVGRWDKLLDQTLALTDEQKTHQAAERFDYRVQITQERIARDFRLSIVKRMASELEPKEWKIERTSLTTSAVAAPS